MSAEQRELQAISPGQVAAYLSAAGWRATARTPTTVKWRLDLKDRDRSLILVTDREDPDYEDYLMVLVARLRDVEQRDGQSIYRDMLDAGRDTLVIRVSAPNITEGEVPVSYGTELYGGVRDLIAAGGRSVRTTRASFAGPTPPEVMDVLDRLTFGESRAGSYVLTVKTPVEQQLSLSDSDPSVAFERRALARTLEAVAAARAAGASLDDEDALDESIERGVSEQLCRALARIDPEIARVTVHLSGAWAPGLPPPSEAQAVSAVSLHRDDLAHVRYLGQTLGKLAPEEEFALEGWIKSITYEALWQTQGTVTVEGRIKGRRREVRLELAGDDLHEAQRLVGHGHITARGTLEKAGRAWVLMRPRGVTFTEGIPPD